MIKGLIVFAAYLMFGLMVWAGYIIGKQKEEAHRKDLEENAVWYAMGGR